MQTRSLLQRQAHANHESNPLAMTIKPRPWSASPQPLQVVQRQSGQNGLIDLFSHDPGPRSTPNLLQTKLTVGAPNDVYEQEADRVAEQVMSMPDTKPAVQREGMPEEEEELQAKPLGGSIQREGMPEEEEEIQTKPLAATITPLVQREAMPEEEEEVQAKALSGSIQREAIPEEEEEPIQTKLIQREAMPEEEHEIQTKKSSDGGFEAGGDFESRLSSKSGGSPLPDDVRSFMEPRFGADFSGVRVHTGGEAVQMNREVGAQAFAHGQDIYFGAGKGPGKDALTAHELTHVMQQTSQLPHTAPLQRTPLRAAPASSPPPSNLASQIKKFSAKLGHAGNIDVTTAQRVGNVVKLAAPGVSYVGSASLAQGVRLGQNPIQVGIIQTVVSSERIGVYRGEGSSAEEGATEQRISFGNVPDVRSGSTPPFYEAPQELTGQRHTVAIVAEDEPKYVLPVSYGSGRLIAVKGSDRFMSSFAAKRGNELLHLKNFAWEAPWSLVLDNNQNGLGKSVTPQDGTKNSPKVPGGEPANVVGKDPNNTVQAYVSQSAADAALRSNKIGFLKDLSRHKEKAPDSYELMIGALSRSSMKLGVKVLVDSTNSRFGKDTINVTASCSKAQTQLVELNDHQSDIVQFQANSVYDPKYLSESTIVDLWINGKMIQWKFPFNSCEATVTNGDRGRYKVEYFLP